MEEKDDWTCGREGDRHPFTQANLQDEFITPIMILRTYMGREKSHQNVQNFRWILFIFPIESRLVCRNADLGIIGPVGPLRSVTVKVENYSCSNIG